MSARIGVALFGIGRAGMIHFMNLIRNHRVAILYIVERDVAKADELVAKFHLTDNTKVVDANDCSTVYQDSRSDGCPQCVCTQSVNHADCHVQF